MIRREAGAPRWRLVRVSDGEKRNDVDALVQFQDVPRPVPVEPPDPAAPQSEIDGTQDHVLDRDGRVHREVLPGGKFVHLGGSVGQRIDLIHLHAGEGTRLQELADAQVARRQRRAVGAAGEDDGGPGDEFVRRAGPQLLPHGGGFDDDEARRLDVRPRGGQAGRLEELVDHLAGDRLFPEFAYASSLFDSLCEFHWSPVFWI